ncbi:MAG: alpha/beta hydrolase [Myxococcales bacterium]|nr:alpha/beta hydrolase [Myxococcales bacterium]
MSETSLGMATRLALALALGACGGGASPATDATPADVAEDRAIAPREDSAVMLDDRSEPALDATATTDAPSATTDAGSTGTPVVIDARAIPAAAALYTVDRRMWSIRDVGRAIESVLSGASRPDNVILYVHGRACGGGEPEKSLTGAMPELARDYSSAPIMLFWPGSDDSCPLGFPEARARESGPALAVVVGDLYNYRLANPARVAGVRFTLVTHSMGSIVLEAATAVRGFETVPPSAFETVVINASASAASGHNAWLARVGLSRHRYVTVNNGDNVLTAAGIGRATRLGKSITSVPLAAGVDYTDFDANNVNHAYYLVSGQSGAGMRAFYERVMNGMEFDFVGAPGVGSSSARDGAGVHVFNGR